MIDSGASDNFISQRLVHQWGIDTRRKQHQFELVAIDGSALPNVSSETEPLTLAFQRHQEEIVFDVADMANHDVVLGYTWLKRHNPNINWRQGVLEFGQCGCVTGIGPVRGRSFAADEIREFSYTSQSTRLLQQLQSTSSDTDKGQTDHKDRGRGGYNAPPEFPQQYRAWKRLFEEEEGAAALPKHQKWDHDIPIMPGKEPTFGPIYALSEKELQALRKYLDENLARGFIRKSTSPAGYPILFAPKKDGSLRLCVDFRKLNDITVKNRYPLPNIGELQDRLATAKWFTKIDLRGAYNLIRMRPGEEWKTAFRTRYGHYEYMVMPFGLTNAPASCQEMVNDVLSKFLDVTVIAYLDDILIYTTGSIERHIRDVQAVLRAMNEWNLKVNPTKCEFHKHEVEFLGFIVGTNGIKIDPSKTESVRQWPQPKTVRDIQSFLGLTNYNRKFIKDYSKLALPLTSLTQKDKPFTWGKAQQQAFDALKTATSEGQALKMFDSKKPIQIETDASDRAVGACLTQEHDSKRLPIAYYSRKLSPAEQNYDIHDKELLAVVAALYQWRVYCEGAPGLTIYTDHKNLLHFTTTKILNRRQTRWSELLGQYKFTIQYTPGRDNGRADALSRRSDYMEGKDAVNHSILKINADGSLSANPQQFNNIVRVLRDDHEEFPIEHGKYQVPQARETKCIQDHHDGEVNGHPGIAKTMERIQRHFAFPNMRSKIADYIKRCNDCQRNKSTRHATYGNLQLIPPPMHPWDEVTMDFITDLPPSKDPATSVFYDAILVMVDRLTKYSHFLPSQKTMTAEQLAYLVLDRLIRHHGLPLALITDRDKLFTSAYWQTLVKHMGIRHKMSTAFHPQTDGQTERTNQTLEAYLRHFVDDTQDNWAPLLPVAQLALNNSRSESTGETPFFANYGKDPNLFTTPMPNPNSDRALRSANEISAEHSRAHDSIKKSQTKIMASRQSTNKNGPLLKKGDKVYLLTRNLKTRRQNKKLDHVKVGPFLIEEQRGALNYRLKLPPDARIHPVFHISLLEPADPNIPLQTTFYFEAQEDDVFTVERIEQFDGSKYLIKWLNYDESESTWEPPENILTCLEELQKFHKDPKLTADFAGPRHWHVDLNSRHHFLRSFPLREITGQCTKCNPRPRGRPRIS